MRAIICIRMWEDCLDCMFLCAEEGLKKISLKRESLLFWMRNEGKKVRYFLSKSAEIYNNFHIIKISLFLGSWGFNTFLLNLILFLSPIPNHSNSYFFYITFNPFFILIPLHITSPNSYITYLPIFPNPQKPLTHTFLHHKSPHTFYFILKNNIISLKLINIYDLSYFVEEYSSYSFIWYIQIVFREIFFQLKNIITHNSLKARIPTIFKSLFCIAHPS